MTERRPYLQWADPAAGEAIAAMDSVGDDTTWQDFALCAQADPEVWFPEKGGSTREPKRICARCPVQAECLEYALDHDLRFGVWGGLSERERRMIRRQHNREAA